MTSERWAATVPRALRFSAKQLTDELRLLDVKAPLARFINEVSGI